MLISLIAIIIGVLSKFKSGQLFGILLIIFGYFILINDKFD